MSGRPILGRQVGDSQTEQLMGGHLAAALRRRSDDRDERRSEDEQQHQAHEADLEQLKP
jgi:hypothetical protein